MSGWILPPAVSAAMAYGGTIACWFLYICCTLRLPSIYYAGPYTMIASLHYWVFTAANALLGVWLVMSWRSARRADVSVRRGQTAGILAALLLLCTLQSGAQALHTDISMREGLQPEAIAAYINRQGEEERLVLNSIRDALKAARPGLSEALFRDALHFNDKVRHGYQFSVQPGLVRLRIQGRFRGPLPRTDPWPLQQDSRDGFADLSISLPLEGGTHAQLKGVIRAIVLAE